MVAGEVAIAPGGDDDVAFREQTAEELRLVVLDVMDGLGVYDPSFTPRADFFTDPNNPNAWKD